MVTSVSPKVGDVIKCSTRRGYWKVTAKENQRLDIELIVSEARTKPKYRVKSYLILNHNGTIDAKWVSIVDWEWHRAEVEKLDELMNLIVKESNANLSK